MLNNIRWLKPVFKFVTACCVVTCLAVSALAEPRQTEYRGTHTLSHRTNLNFSDIKRLYSFSVKARIIPRDGSGPFDFVVSFNPDQRQPRATAPSSGSFLLSGDSCSGPLDFSFRSIDSEFVYAYSTFDEAFSPVKDIDIEFVRMERKKGKTSYLARVNEVEQVVSFDDKIRDISLYVRGADMQLSDLEILEGS